MLPSVSWASYGKYRWQITAGVIATGGQIASGVNMIDDENL
jgi:hypothetical protein